MESKSTTSNLLEMFRRATHWLHRYGHHFQKNRSRPMMPPAQGRLLKLLAEKGLATQRSLSEELNLRSASLSELLSKLERHGWISRRPNSEDKRTVDVTLTKEGNDMKDAIFADHQEAASEIFSALTMEESEQLYILMDKLINSWESKFGPDSHEHMHGFDRHRGHGEHCRGRHGKGCESRHHHGHHHHPGRSEEHEHEAGGRPRHHGRRAAGSADDANGPDRQ